jgi:hypothetical protein
VPEGFVLIDAETEEAVDDLLATTGGAVPAAAERDSDAEGTEASGSSEDYQDARSGDEASSDDAAGSDDDDEEVPRDVSGYAAVHSWPRSCRLPAGVVSR